MAETLTPLTDEQIARHRCDNSSIEARLLATITAYRERIVELEAKYNNLINEANVTLNDTIEKLGKQNDALAERLAAAEKAITDIERVAGNLYTRTDEIGLRRILTAYQSKAQGEKG